MGLESGRITTSNKITPNSVSKSTESGYGVVYDIILNKNSKLIKQKKLEGTYSIGAIQFRLLDDKTTPNELLPIAYPLNKNINSLPLRNEIVIIHTPSDGGDYYYTKSAEELNPYQTAISNLISSKFQPKKQSSGGNSKEYQKVSNTNITRKNTSQSTNDYDGFGNYYTQEIGGNIHKLKLYEGDTLLESRFGQSIRLSGYNNSDNEFYPTISIRNGENPESFNSEVTLDTEEDINNDGNIIFLSSGDRLLDYILPIENKKESFFNYPNELRGNQILLNSDRIILSAKNAEMIGVAKKDIGFITDGQFSIDSTQGINITTEAGIFVDTKNRDINMNIGNGVVALGTDGDLEAAVKGETLVEILKEFMTIVAQQIFVTPAGPTSPGPTNNPQINALHSKLNTILSNHVQLK